MRTKRFNSALLSTLIIVSLLAPMLVLTSTAEAQASSIIVVRGKDTAYTPDPDLRLPPGWVKYIEGDRPPLMVARRVGSGAAIAAGFIPAFRNGDWDRSTNPDPHLPELLDAAFQWMAPGATEVLWYEGYFVYNNTATCSNLVAALEALGYTITGDGTMPITSSLLAPYDILIIPQLQLGTIPGNPDLLPDADVAAIKAFAEGGKGVLVTEATDFFPHQFTEVQNKILLALGFDYLFQPDSVYDDTNNIEEANYRAIVDVDETTDIGAAYKTATGKTTIGLYGYSSLAVAVNNVGVSILPDYQVGMPGTTLEYSLWIFNVYNPVAEDLTYNLTVEDNSGWELSIFPTSVSVPTGENRTVTLVVTIPAGTEIGTEDEIVVTAVASEYPEVKDNSICIAYAGKRIEPTVDAYVYTADPDKTYGADDPLPLYTGRYDDEWQHTYLKFDLSTIPSGVSITDARLYLFCYTVYRTQVPIAATEVDDDTWDELAITWNNKPENGPVLDLQLVRVGSRSFPISYSWDVTSFVDQEFEGDKVVSLSVRGLDNHPSGVNESFESKDWPYENRVHPFLRVSYATPPRSVDVSISPDENEAENGQTVTFTVTVTNTGSVTDSYTLESTDTAGWTMGLSKSSVGPLSPNASEDVTLSVTIPAGAENGDEDTITIIATSQADSTVSDSDSGIARCVVAVERGVQVSISPTSKSSAPGEELNFSITVTNTGTATDTFSLTASDTGGWGPTLSIPSTTLAGGASRTSITLTVTIPSTAAEDDSTTITVTASGTGYDNSVTCTATAKAPSEFPIIPVAVVVIIVVIIAAVLILRR